MPIYKTKDENFFKKWTSEMAYVLGFIAADGSLIKNKRGACFIEIQSIDKEIIYKIKKVLHTNLKIGAYQSKHINYKKRYRLEIGSKEIFNDLLNLGLTPRKSKIIELPNIPKQYFAHFVRGYFDGDGNVTFGFYKKSDRKSKSPILSTRFVAGSKSILEKLKHKLKILFQLNGSLYYSGNAWRLSYSTNDSKKIFRFMYRNNNIKHLIYLERKYNIYKKAINYFERSEKKRS